MEPATTDKMLQPKKAGQQLWASPDKTGQPPTDDCSRPFCVGNLPWEGGSD